MASITEVFWVTFVATISGMIIKLASMWYKSKCKEVEVCCLKIVRDTVAEEKEEEYRMVAKAEAESYLEEKVI